uniref:Uncharacterized protein n=1 Tax=Megaselia scalaris TaxID=36166 RepID=T1GKC0_MEGSC
MVRIVKKDQEKIELLASLNRVNEEFEGTDDNKKNLWKIIQV